MHARWSQEMGLFLNSPSFHNRFSMIASLSIYVFPCIRLSFNTFFPNGSWATTAKSYRQHPNSRVFLDIFIVVRDQNETKLYQCRSVF